MECSIGNSANFVVPETQNILAHCPKVRKVLFLPGFRPLECSTGHEECLTDEHWVFLQIRFSSEQPSKDIRLYFPPNKVLPKSSSGHVHFVFDTLVENFCHKSGISSFKIRKECQTYFFWKKTLLSQSFSLLNIWNAVLTTPLKTFRQQNIIFSLIAHKSKTFGDCQIFSHEMLDSAGHVECLPGSSSFCFEVSVDAKCADLITLADPFSKDIEIFR